MLYQHATPVSCVVSGRLE